MTEKEKMLAGKLYDPTDPELLSLREKAHRLSQEINCAPEDRQKDLIAQLLPNRGKDVDILPPLFFDYGVFTEIGERTFINANFSVLDCCPFRIGKNVMIGTNVTILTPMHPLLPQERNLRVREDGSFYDLEYAKPITIEDDCWIAGGVTICGGVTIGRGSVIGAGSVVTRDIPAGVVAFGNPCRVIRPITEADSVKYKPELF